jgi:DNA-binding response OmpR family regulator
MENKKKVLLVEIVEDEKSLKNVLHDKFEEEGFHVISAQNGEQGLGLALQEHPDIILLDLIMPKMGGIEMLEELRKDSWGKNIPVIVLSNLNDSDHIAKAVEQGSFDYLVKTDHTLEDVVKRVKEKLKV